MSVPVLVLWVKAGPFQVPDWVLRAKPLNAEEGPARFSGGWLLVGLSSLSQAGDGWIACDSLGFLAQAPVLGFAPDCQLQRRTSSTTSPSGESISRPGKMRMTVILSHSFTDPIPNRTLKALYVIRVDCCHRRVRLIIVSPILEDGAGPGQVAPKS